MYEELLERDPAVLAERSPDDVVALAASLQVALRNSLRVSRSLSEHLQEAEAELEDVARILSHDIRAPLRQFNSFVGLLDASTEALPSGASEYVSHLKDSTRDLSDRIDSVSKAIRSRQGVAADETPSPMDAVVGAAPTERAS